ncbi:NAD-dependent epimerase/dehydratase family protein [Mucilaginibacter sp. HMF5004]|uniref:NAD-dependent epimerase/dehydratase family protein n=1 Tax=Mucilaginibacter rivuli TaxID=2857527 RepID=UPI001C5F4C59|nr:NAD-dependent epimerase/dehydratase family protein [Mucilaginibacter rivuli]MBW4890097.1 NAD-dependent epimerase/dehydratase family protein [Mucilaginibacter rivuli]
MISVLITGSSGFVGANLIDHLHDKGIAVSVLNRKHHTDKKIKQSFTWDNFTVKELDGINAIIHLAGKAHDVKNASNPDEYFAVNTGLTQKIFDAFAKSNVHDFIYFSSVKAVADTVDDVLYEDAPYLAKTPYGQSKEQAEKYLLAQTIDASKRLFILRPCMIHGPGNKGNLNLLYKVVLKGIPYPLAAFQNKRSFLSVDNLTYAIEKIITGSTIASGIYNLADDEALSTNSVIMLIANVVGSKPKLWKINSSLITAVAKIGDVLHLPLNAERLKKLTESYVVSNAKIKKAFNISGFPVSSTEGLKKTIRSFQSQ